MIVVKDFDLRLSMESGQPLAFYGDYFDNGRVESVTYPTTKGIITAKCRKHGTMNVVSVNYAGNYTHKEAEQEVIRRFGLADDMPLIYRRIGTDRFMREAVKRIPGLRVTRNEPWETTLCFIISQFNNIKRIRLIVKTLIRRFGEEIRVDGRAERLFPTPASMAKAGIDELRGCGLGFRAKFVKNAAMACSDADRLERIGRMDYAAAKRELCGLDGVGEKVADCILLMGYNRLEAFPVDSWIKRIVEYAYFRGRRKKENEIRGFAAERWDGNAGYAQQYLYWYGRLNKIGK